MYKGRRPHQGHSNCLSKLGSWNGPRRLPGGLVSEHSIENDQQLAHASSQRHLLLFAGTKQAMIEGFDNQIVFGGYQSGHVERSANASAATSGSSFTVPLAAVARVRRQAAKSDELLVC